MLKRLLILMVAVTCWSHNVVAEDRLALIQQRGSLIVGIKADYPPWGMVDKLGQLVGLEADLAHDLAERLGVKLKLVGVSSSNRLQKVEDGSVDLIIATMGDTSKRRQLAGLLEPNYYASGVNVLLHKGMSVKSWSDLRGRSICLTDGAYYNRTLIERYLFLPVVFKGTRDSALGLENDRCLGWAYDDLALGPLPTEDGGRWKNHEMPLPSILISPWAMAVKSDARDGAWGRFVSDIIVEWHQTGFLIEREAAWGIPPSSYLVEQRTTWLDPACARRDDGTFPPACLDQNLLKASGRVVDVYGQGLAMSLHEIGIDFPPLYDDFSLMQLLKGGVWTLLLSITAIIGSLVFGIGAGVALSRTPRPWRALLEGGLSIFYMTPPILNLYLLLFGVGGWLAKQYGIALEAFWVAGVVFSLYAGGSNAVIISLAMDWVHDQHPERTQLRDIIAQAIERGYGGLIANSINIVKAVGIASAIAVPEVIFASSSIVAEHGETTEMMNFLMLFYLVLVSGFVVALDKTKEWVMRWVLRTS